MTPLVALDGVTKRFPGVLAVDRVDVGFRAGEVHVLLGENGAGKSTLVAMLAGLVRPDAGAILVDGARAELASPKASLAAGIGTVFQHGMLAPSLTVGENLALGTPWWRRRRAGAGGERFEALCRGFGVAIDQGRPAAELSLGERQQVEIFKSLMRGSRLLALDEPTAMLTPRGVSELGRLMRKLAAGGIGILFITHKLSEACAFGDRVTVLRRGREVGTFGPERLRAGDQGTLQAEIVELMFESAAAAGRSERHRAARPRAAPVLSVRDLVVPRLGQRVTFAVGAGEILGIAGIDGNGQKELAEALAGQRPTPGEVTLDGRSLAGLGVGARRRLGLRYVSDDRMGEATVASFGVDLNLVLKDIGRPPLWRRGIARPAAITARARRLISEFDVRTPGPGTPIGRLSGGNVQKAVLARELAGEARLVVYSKPTHGLDVRNTAATRARLRAAADAGTATILVSTDLDEILELADRVAVMARGRIVAVLANDGDARRRVGELMVGGAAGGLAA